MRIGVTAKLFAGVFATALVVVVVMAFAQRYAFEHGFLAYVNRVELERLQALTEDLAEYWRTHGDWTTLAGQRRRWFRLLVGALHARSGDMPEARAPAGDDGLRAHPPEEADPGLGMNHRFGLAPPRPFDPIRLGPRLTLFDTEHRIVVGNPRPAPDAVQQAITVDGRIVGYLTVTPFRRLTSEMDKRFAANQRNAALVIAVFALLVAAAVALPLSRHLLRPIRALATGTRALAAGDFSARVSATSRDELGRLARDFNVLARTLEHNERARREFMADVSHELRTPLAVLRGEVEALEDGVRAPTPEALASLQQEIRALAKLIDDLHALALADVGALTYRFGEVDVGELVRSVVGALSERAETLGITMGVTGTDESPVLAFADTDRLRQLLSALLDNALRYTTAPGRVEISYGRDMGRIALDIQDTAPSVDERQLGRLFERFYRAETSRSREHGGAGLGLAICRSIVDAHGGTIEARPSPLGGMWIAVRLPSAETTGRPG